MRERMVRLKITLGFGILALLCIVQGPVAADVIHLSSGQRLTNVQVLSKNWRGYEVQLTSEVTIFFSRDEIVGVERDDIEPGRDARRRWPTDTSSQDAVHKAARWPCGTSGSHRTA